MTHIIAISANLQAGKTTACNFLHGHEMQRADQTGDFTYRINEAGQLVVRTVAMKDDKPHFDEGVLDVSQKNYEFVKYATNNIWPYIRVFNFADTLKDIAVEVLGLDWEQCYGTDAQKNTQTKLRWETMPSVITDEKLYSHLKDTNLVFHAPGVMTGREVLQYLGTDIFRRMYTNVWVDTCLRQIREEEPAIAVIGDCRFLNEVEAVQEAGGKVIHLTRNSDNGGKHLSENDLKGFDKYDAEVDNRDMTIAEANAKVLELLVYWGVTSFIRPRSITTVRAPA